MSVGATIWARKTIESEIFYKKPDKWFKIWFYIVSKVSYQDSDRYNKGEGFMTGEQIRLATGCSVDQLKKCLNALRKMQMISTERSTRGFFIKVLNYAKYQDLVFYSSTDSGTREAPEKHQRSTTIYKEIKEIKKERNSPTENEQARPDKRNPEINEMLIALKESVGVDAFADSSIERNIAKHCVGLYEKIGKDEFKNRLNYVLSDDFKRKNCNRIKYLYSELKSVPVKNIKPNII